jgi:hypothetical protein
VTDNFHEKAADVKLFFAPAEMLIADQREARRRSFAESYISIDFLMPRKTHARPFSTAGRSRKLRSNPSLANSQFGAISRPFRFLVSARFSTKRMN